MNVILVITMSFGPLWSNLSRSSRGSKSICTGRGNAKQMSFFEKSPCYSRFFDAKTWLFFKKTLKKQKNVPIVWSILWKTMHCLMWRFAYFLKIDHSMGTFFSEINISEKTGFSSFFVFKTSKNWCVFNMLGKLVFRWRQDFS